MSDYYNDINPFCCVWLNNLIAAGEIAGGVVDDRSIEHLDPARLARSERVHLCAGLGGWALALRLARWVGPCWTVSFPCQPFSSAGKQLGFSDERHIYPAGRRLIAHCRPPIIFGEQVASKAGREWLAFVRDDLATLGYAVGAADLCAAGIGADHIRQRIYWVAIDVANTQRDEQPRQEPCGREVGRVGRVEQPVPWDEPWPSALARLRAEQDGLPRNVDGTDAARNAIVPQLAQAFIEAVMEAA